MIFKRFKSNFKVGKLNHIAIATRDAKSHLNFFGTVLQAEIGAKLAQPEHGVYTTFVNLPNTKIEILEELITKDNPISPITNFLEKNPRGGIHHMCYEVDDISASMEHLKSLGIEPIGKEPKIGAHGNPVIFLHPRDCNGILTELEEVKRNSSNKH